jgi:hypothetical protein
LIRMIWVCFISPDQPRHRMLQDHFHLCLIPGGAA